MRRFLLFQSFWKAPWRLLQWSWFVLRLEAEVCNFSRNKLHRKHFLEKFWRQRQFFYLLCFKAFGKHLWNDYCGVLFSKGWRKYSITSAEMNFFVQTFSLKRTEGRHNFFIYFVSKLLEKSFELTKVELFFKKLRAAVSVTVPEMNPIMDIFLRTSQRHKQLISFAFFKRNVEILTDDCSGIHF